MEIAVEIILCDLVNFDVPGAQVLPVFLRRLNCACLVLELDISFATGPAFSILAQGDAVRFDGKPFEETPNIIISRRVGQPAQFGEPAVRSVARCACSAASAFSISDLDACKAFAPLDHKRAQKRVATAEQA